jgi:hypothetical protein
MSQGMGAGNLANSKQLERQVASMAAQGKPPQRAGIQATEAILAARQRAARWD